MPKRSRPRCVLLNWRDFLADPAVASMSPAALGAYVRLLGVAWEMIEPGVLPDRDDRLSIWSRMHNNWWRVRPAVSLAFDVASRPGFWLQRRLIEEHANAVSVSGKRREASQIRHTHQTPLLVPPSETSNSLPANAGRGASALQLHSTRGQGTEDVASKQSEIEKKASAKSGGCTPPLPFRDGLVEELEARYPQCDVRLVAAKLAEHQRGADAYRSPDKALFNWCASSEKRQTERRLSNARTWAEGE